MNNNVNTVNRINSLGTIVMKCGYCKTVISNPCLRRQYDNSILRLCKKCASLFDTQKHLKRTYPCPIAMEECFKFKNINIMDGHNNIH